MFGAAAIAAVAASCFDSSPTHIVRSPTRSLRALSHDDSVAHGYFGARSSARRPHAATFDAIADGTASIVSATPSLFQGFAQPEAIEIALSGPVNSVTVVGDGAIECSGSYGILIGFDAGGAELGRTPLELIDPTDCSPDDNPDNVTFGAQATLTVTNGIIARAEITPMSPVEFPVFDLTGHASQTYTVTLGVAAPATLQVTCDASVVRGDVVKCLVSMSDTSVFTITHVKTTSNGTTILDADVTGQSPVRSFSFQGRAAVPTTVVITAQATSGSVTGTGSFSVQSRIGASPAWLDPDFQNFPATPPAAQFVSGTPLSAPYPGIIINRDNGYTIPEGAAGYTVMPFPSQGGLLTITGGPNRGVRFVLSLQWLADSSAGGAAVGIYLSKALQATDPFYQRQKGPAPNCTQADMATLADLLQRHENGHWTTARQQVQALHTATVIEGLVGLPGATNVVDNGYKKASEDYAKTIAAANGVAEKAISVQDGSPVCNLVP